MKATFKMPQNKLSASFNMGNPNTIATKAELNAEIEARIEGDSTLQSEITRVENEIPDISNLATKDELEQVEGEIPDISGLATKTELQAVENEIPDISNLATKTELQEVENEIPVVNNGTLTIIQNGETKGVFRANDSNNVTVDLEAGGGGAVDSVNGQTGDVVLTASDVSALPNTTVIPTKTSDLTNDSDYVNQTDLQNALDEKQDTLTFSTGLTDTSGTITVTDYAKLLKNTATRDQSLTINGNASTQNQSINIGMNSTVSSNLCVALGFDAQSTKAGGVTVGYGTRATGSGASAYGYFAKATANYAIQLGNGTNSTSYTLAVGFNNTNYQLLNGTTGKIPNARLNTLVGADGTNAGTAGIVPAPTATDNTKFLRGDGTWADFVSEVSTDLLTIGNTSINESQLQALLALI